MVESPQRTVDWPEWLRRWDAMQAAYLPKREERFGAMLDVLASVLPEEFVALDLACGPGAISQRLLARFPHARVVAVDLDPVLLALGHGALGTMDGRLRWVEADIGREGLSERVHVVSFDAVMSTTALHWLSAAQLISLYGQLGKLVRSGGLFLNGDHLVFGPNLPTFQKVIESMGAKDGTEAGESGTETWEQWWDAVANEPLFSELSAERTRRFPSRTHGENAPSFDMHVAVLHDAGFREVGTLWQNLDDRVLMAVR